MAQFNDYFFFRQTIDASNECNYRTLGGGKGGGLVFEDGVVGVVASVRVRETL